MRSRMRQASSAAAWPVRWEAYLEAGRLPHRSTTTLVSPVATPTSALALDPSSAPRILHRTRVRVALNSPTCQGLAATMLPRLCQSSRPAASHRAAASHPASASSERAGTSQTAGFKCSQRATPDPPWDSTLFQDTPRLLPTCLLQLRTLLTLVPRPVLLLLQAGTPAAPPTTTDPRCRLQKSRRSIQTSWRFEFRRSRTKRRPTRSAWTALLRTPSGPASPSAYSCASSAEDITDRWARTSRAFAAAKWTPGRNGSCASSMTVSEAMADWLSSSRPTA
mmetsp:Transcript_54879/g.157810  ORF Transcript_54879/g.157810 Transcript_54879/m.157810 type:complete len:279 (+) Transcript_54879:230-1066(+)